MGRAEVIHALKKHPMARALRLDKMTLAALEATLGAYLEEERALREIPTLRMLTTPQAEIRVRAEVLAARIRESVADAADVTTADDTARAGGGALPLADIPSAVVAISPRSVSAGKLEALLRCGGEPAIVARVKDDRVLFDPRTLLSLAEEDAIVARLGEVLG
jgi:L-seryl-tRNA(Ser) seleniumtransferase